MTTRPTTRIAALFAATTLVGAFAACGDTINNNGATCGAGTRLENGTCVAVTDATTDTGVADTGAEVPDSSAPLDASSGDAAADAAEPDTEDPSPDDPCPASQTVVNCDPLCGAVNPLCAASMCHKDDSVPPWESGWFERAWNEFPHITTRNGLPEMMVRLPRNPIESMGECYPKPLATQYPNQAPRKRFMMAVFNVHGSSLTTFDTYGPTGFDNSYQAYQFGYEQRGGRPLQITSVGDANAQRGVRGPLRHWEIIDSTTKWKDACADSIPQPLYHKEVNEYRAFVIGVDRKIAAKNVLIFSSPVACP